MVSQAILGASITVFVALSLNQERRVGRGIDSSRHKHYCSGMKMLRIAFVLALTLFSFPAAVPVGHLFAQTDQQENKELTVYVTRTGKRYHRENCNYLRYSSRAIALKDAVAEGYSVRIQSPGRADINQSAEFEPRARDPMTAGITSGGRNLIPNHDRRPTDAGTCCAAGTPGSSLTSNLLLCESG
jgi:hypothetical protein